AAISMEVMYPALEALERDLHRDLLSLLTEEQTSHFERAARRMTIALRDGLHPHGTSSPVWFMDMLGLLDEAFADGSELHPLIDSLHLQWVENVGAYERAHDEGIKSMRHALEQFEVSYESVLQTRE